MVSVRPVGRMSQRRKLSISNLDARVVACRYSQSCNWPYLSLHRQGCSGVSSGTQAPVACMAWCASVPARDASDLHQPRQSGGCPHAAPGRGLAGAAKAWIYTFWTRMKHTTLLKWRPVDRLWGTGRCPARCCCCRGPSWSASPGRRTARRPTRTWTSCARLCPPCPTRSSPRPPWRSSATLPSMPPRGPDLGIRTKSESEN